MLHQYLYAFSHSTGAQCTLHVTPTDALSTYTNRHNDNVTIIALLYSLVATTHRFFQIHQMIDKCRQFAISNTTTLTLGVDGKLMTNGSFALAFVDHRDALLLTIVTHFC